MRLNVCDAHTLARKFDAVHRNTVKDSRKIPNVLRATLSNPTPARKPRGFNIVDEDIDPGRRSPGMSTATPNPPALDGGTGGSCALIGRMGIVKCSYRGACKSWRSEAEMCASWNQPGRHDGRTGGGRILDLDGIAILCMDWHGELQVNVFRGSPVVVQEFVCGTVSRRTRLACLG